MYWITLNWKAGRCKYMGPFTNFAVAHCELRNIKSTLRKSWYSIGWYIKEDNL